MKKIKTIFLSLLLVAAMCSMTSCATVFGGHVSECQKTKPVAGSPSRSVRVGALILDIVLFSPGVIVDFATGAIYKPCAKK